MALSIAGVLEPLCGALAEHAGLGREPTTVLRSSPH